MPGNYNAWLSWGGLRGSPCGDLAEQRERQALHARDPRYPASVHVSFPELADCRECPVCGDCETHQGCLTDLAHMEWHAQFASPGEPACVALGVIAGRSGFACALPIGHGGELHKDRLGNGWR